MPHIIQGLSLWDIGNTIQRDLFDENRRSRLEQVIYDLLGASPTKEDILSTSDDIVVEVVRNALVNVDYLTRKHQQEC
jgi:hypothetical protein